ncbi:MAG: PIG-L family deacetylase [Chloroflexota bacterium]
MKKLLAIFAHPDDEGAIAGTLAAYARQGVEVSLICTTRGEVGEISDPALATPETLGEVRTKELETACEVLGIQNLHFLGYRDSGMQGTPENEDPRSLVQADSEEAIERLVGLMRQLKPDVVVTFEPFGWYGHPDHQTTGRFATAAYERLDDAAAYPAAGSPWQPQRLYQAVMPASNFEKIMAIAKEYDIDMSGFEQLPLDILRETESQVTHILDQRALYDVRQTAMMAHKTQFGEDSIFQKIPEQVAQETFGKDYFIQVYPEPAETLRAEQASDLFEG